MRSNSATITACCALAGLLSTHAIAAETPARQPVEPTAAKSISLDGFLSGFLAGCRQPEAFERFFSEMQTQAQGKPWQLTGKVLISNALRPAVGKPVLETSIQDDVNLATVTVPMIAATFHGLKVKALTNSVSDGYGLIDQSIVFDETEKSVQAKLKSAVGAAQKKLIDQVTTLEIDTGNEAVALTCLKTN